MESERRLDISLEDSRDSSQGPKDEIMIVGRPMKLYTLYVLLKSWGQATILT